MANANPAEEKPPPEAPSQEKKKVNQKTTNDDFDVRVEFISTFVLKLLKLKPEKWQKLMQSEDKNLLIKFIDTPTMPVITFVIGHGGQLQATIGFSFFPKSKTVYFIRQMHDIVTQDNARKVLLFGTLSNELVHELIVFTDEILSPILCNPKNHVEWPKIITDDVKKHVINFKNTLYQIRGIMNNQVILPMPDGVEKIEYAEKVLISSNGENMDIYLKTNIEGVIIQWAMQVNKVLKENSSIITETKKFPNPMDELNFWSSRLKNLEGIYTQLRLPRVKKMAVYLEMTNSVYLSTFKSILTNLIAGIVEARDIVIHQAPLIKHFENFEKYNFIESKNLMRPMMHCIGLLWANSRYYRRTEKIIVLLRNMGNMVIEQSIVAYNQQNIFYGEAFELVVKINQILSSIDNFLEVYQMNRQKIETFFTGDTMPMLWNFENERVFGRLYEFIKRLKMARHILQTTVEMLKLEKVEFAGIRGRIHSEKTSEIFERYSLLYSKICDIEYDPLDTEDEQFPKEYDRFVSRVSDLDRCLAKLFGEAFDDCSSMAYIFKLLQIIGDLANRPTILNELQPRYEVLFNYFNEELRQIEILFHEGVHVYDKSTQNPMIDKHFPPVAGFLWWIHKLRQRITVPMTELTQNEILSTCIDKINMLQKRFDEIIKNLDETEIDHYNKWAESVPKICEKYMSTPLFEKNGALLKLNFANELTCLLQEIRYLKYLERYELPKEGLDFFERTENFQLIKSKLNMAISWYNKIQKDSHTSEIALIEQEIEDINEVLRRGIEEINWSLNVDSYVEEVFTIINKLQKRVLIAQSNIKQAFEQIAGWINYGMYDRSLQQKAGRCLLDFHENDARKNKRLENIALTNKKTTEVMDQNYSLYFNIDIDDNSSISDSEDHEESKIKYKHTDSFRQANWPEYENYIDNKLKVTVIEAVTKSLITLLSNMDSTMGVKIPFLEVIVELRQPNIVFYPNLDEDENGLEATILNMIDDIIEQAQLFKRISKNAQSDNYSTEVETHKQVTTMKHRLIEIVKHTIYDIKIYIEIYGKYSFIWLNDSQEFLQNFLRTGKLITKESLISSDLDDTPVSLDEPLTSRPPLDTFKNQIDVFEDLYKECEKIYESHLFNGWLLLNMKALKQALLNIVSKWGNIFKQELVEYVLKRIHDLNDFVENTINILSTDIKDNDYEGLLRIMDCLRNVREHQYMTTEDVFEPLKEYVELLKTYGIEFPEELYDENGKKKHSVYTLLEVLPEKWKSLLKLASSIKHNVAPLKIHQAHVIGKQIILFNKKIDLFRNKFKNKKFFTLQFDDIYESINDAHMELKNYEDSIVSLNKSCELFDVVYPDVKPIEAARKELTMAKQLWDYYFLVEYTIEDWKKTPWKSIDAEGMDVECKRFTKDLKSLDKEIRSWEPFIAIESIIKNLLTSLRAVTELQNPAIRDRHWIELMQTTKYERVNVTVNSDLDVCTSSNHSSSSHTPETNEKHPHSSHTTTSTIESKIKFDLSDFYDSSEEDDELNECGSSKVNADWSLDFDVKNMYRPHKQSQTTPKNYQKRAKSENEAKTMVKIQMEDNTTLASLLSLNLHKYEDEVKNIVDKSVKEAAMERTLKELKVTWSNLEFQYEDHGRTNLKIPKASEDLVETLEDNQTQVQNMMASKFVGHFEQEVVEWQKKLSNADQAINVWFEVQRKWLYLESIFIGSEDIRSQLPDDSKRFDKIDEEFKEIVEQIHMTPNVIEATNRAGLYEGLDGLLTNLIVCEKALNDYLETKRLSYPRFYFVSSADLLDILSNGNTPEFVCRHLIKLYDSLAKLVFYKNKEDCKEKTFIAYEMLSKENDEHITFKNSCDCCGKVEVWLNRVTDCMKETLHDLLSNAINAYEEKSRDQWLFDWPAQIALVGTQIWWTIETNQAFFRLEEGYENALKEYQKKQIVQLNALITLLLGDLTVGDRQKIMTICTIDVHSRDVVAKMIASKVDTSNSFMWHSQLRHRWDNNVNDCFGNICDAQFQYAYEYLGNTPRLVITPLTDRCYITLTQSLHLIMGGAPAGPAGTGKTETTKDLGRALGVMVYVFNCSEQMDYKSCGNIYKGLAQTGAWGCFDEFNRISVEVLSVVSVQVKSIQDAIKHKRQVFNFMGEKIKLQPTVGIFITMNPGYAGRTELPENIKSLFRPCAMVVPDFELICEIMLVAEGFQEARLLARKFITLYTLCKELLSKQDHYDWGLRAIKSVLVIAGSLKRGDRERPEDQVLMRALRDFNIPKIVTDDIPVFMGLIGDLFPALDVPRKRDIEFEKMCQKAAIDMRLQPEPGFILKIVQLVELFAVRHSVFIIGSAGTGKTCVWKCLYRTYQLQKQKPYYNDLDPKAVTNDELFGVINAATREWKDGLFSVIMRDMVNMSGEGAKWIILDGDIDPMWIESLNTLMDDNKILTLASNERISLTKSMRLLFEISNLKTATPATVSRAGILYINPQDLGWNPYVTSWIDGRDDQTEKTILSVLFDKYIPSLLDSSKKFKKITPLTDIQQVQMVTYLLECFLTKQTIPNDSPKEWYEMYFVFCCIWGFGSALFQDQMYDWRIEFNKWFTNEFKTVTFPSIDNIFDYYIDPETKTFEPWSKKVEKFYFDTDTPLQQCLVNTIETTRLRFFMDLLLTKKHPFMLVGGVGCGKSVVVQDKLTNLPENYLVTNVPFNFYTTSDMLQRVLEKPLEKKSGRNFGPPGNKTMIYFIDDMNMPEVDRYGTVQPHTLIRQFMNYKHWYDRSKLTLKDIRNCQFVSCMNPTAGSFVIDPRLQRHFCVFAVSFPSQDSCYYIYQQILSSHLSSENGKFLPILCKIEEAIVRSALVLHTRISSIFLPTAVKFHYIFNMRDLANVFQGILYATGDTVKTPSELVRLWMHESTRVYCDKLVNEKDIDTFQKIISETIKKGFDEIEENVIHVKPLIYCHFAEGIGDPKYMPISGWDHLTQLLNEGLSSYNDMVATMNLVLFEDAMNHICRINRILELPRGNALLIGVGGSGKQSLSRLSSYLSGLEVFQLQLRKGYSIIDLKDDLAAIYLKAGLKNIGTVFLMTDAQVADERFLVLINDLLASGEIPDLFTDEDIENIINGVRTETKASGMQDTKENCWKFFIDRVRRQLKVVLCFSPVGTTLRIRSRKFPAIVNCTSINWFHEWPQEALRSVSKQFLSELPELPKNLIEPVALFMSYVHTTVNNVSIRYYQKDRRHNYTTPKSFLEQISLYSKLLRDKSESLKLMIKRLENGLLKLESCAKDVETLKVTLAEQEVLLKVKNKAAEELISVVGAESDRVSKEKGLAAEEEKKVKVIEEDVSIKAKICADDLAKAEPALIAAQEALNTLNKNNLTELKSFGTPPDAVVNVTAAVSVLLAKKGKIPKDRSWKACKVMMAKVDQFLSDLVNYDKENILPDVVKAIQPFIKDPDFLPETILSKSSAAAGLCAWVINIMKFYEIYVIVEPKRRALAAANAELAAARVTLSQLKEKISELEQRLAILLAEFQEAVDEKLKCQAEADRTTMTIELANRLVNGLSSEKVRWTVSVGNLRDRELMMPGDILLITAFISYVGCFTHSYRLDLLNDLWIPFLYKVDPKIPITDHIDPLMLLTDDAQIATWNNEGLPSDRMSTENATILTNSERWPLMIDPQLQGIKWIKNHYGEKLKIVRLTTHSCIEIIEHAIQNGDVLLIENISESIDAVLDPLLGRTLIKKGKVIKIGDKEIDYNPNFRLILQTKLANPHYQPEMQAQCILINFTVTRNGLEEQLLGDVVKAERPDLESTRADLTKQQNDFKITLKTLEDDLLCRLSSAGPDILSDSALVVNLETTKKTAAKIAAKVKEAKITSQKIDEAREHYRPAAERASLLYFILTDLSKINPIYQFSLKAYSSVFNDALSKTKPDDKLNQRVLNLLDNITFSVYMYTSRGLFESDKSIFLCQMALQIQLSSESSAIDEVDFLLRFPVKPITSPYPWLSDKNWGGVCTLAKMEDFLGLDKDIEGASKRWLKFTEGETPEKDKLPGEWKNKTPLQRLCIMRALRLDRMTYATRYFIKEKLGAKFVQAPMINFKQSFEESNPSTPIFFILSPGVDPIKDVEKLGQQLGYTTDNQNFHIVSLGQGQEVIAEKAMDIASLEGHWVMLQNIHLVSKWLDILEKKIEQCSEECHENYRLFLSAEPAADPQYHIIPQGILESAIKITNEPPTGMKANLHKALDNFSQETLEMCSKEVEFKSILFSLCYFHAVVAERRKFGPQGWNRNYPFNAGDLFICVNVLYNYLENNSRIPWEDLRYLFGEIMYGGHITDDWDRRLCRTYLSEYMLPELIDGELTFAPGFVAPLNSDFQAYHAYIENKMPNESPYLYGLHPNAEIGVLSTQSESLFRTIFEMQPHDTDSPCGTGQSREDKVKAVLEDILDKIPEQFHIPELMGKVEERTPFIIVAFQECERMNILMGEMKRSLKELEFGFKGELTITAEMEDLENCLYMDQVPPRWTNLAYPSQLSLGAWFADLCMRLTELENWTGDFALPVVVWLGAFFNPQSFLTAIMQQTARKNEWPLDKMCLSCDVTKKFKDEFNAAPIEGAHIHGLYMEGARWDIEQGCIVESRLKELFPSMPVVYVKAVTQDKIELRNTYDCPIYKIRMRGPTYVWTFNLKTKEKPAKWTLAGVCLLLGI